jgi:hypothetical protein
VLITEVEPLKSGARLLRVGFIRLIAPLRAVQECQTWHIDYRSTGAVCATTVNGTPSREQILIVPLIFRWLRQFQPRVLRRFEGSWDFQENDSQIQDYMRWHFGASVDLVLTGVTQARFRSQHRLAGFPSEDSIKFGRLYQGLDAWLLLRGFQPQSSDDKWFIHVDWDGPEMGSIFVRRTAGTILYWEVPFWVEGSNVRARMARVNLDKRKNRFGTSKCEAQQLDAVLGRVLLGDPGQLLKIGCDETRESGNSTPEVW